MRFFRNLFRHYRDGFRNLFRNGWMTVASILTMALTLFMVSGLILMMGNVQKITRDMEKGVQVRAYIDIAANKEDEAQLRSEIEKIEHVKGVTYRTKDQELQDTIKNVGKEFELFSGDSNPMYNVFVIDVDKAENVKSTTEKVSQLKFVAQAKDGGVTSENLFKNIEIIRSVMALASAIFVVIAVLLISNTIRLTIYARQNEIEIMRLVGAKNSFIRAPFQIEGSLIGIIGAGVALACLYAVYQGLQKAAPSQFGITNLNLIPTFPMFYYIGGLMILFGWFLGYIGARRSLGKFLKF